MRINKATEAILSKYSPPSKPRIFPVFTKTSSKKKGSTLEELYQELQSKSNLHAEHVYNGKNAQEIESIMLQNRRLIDAQRKLKR